LAGKPVRTEKTAKKRERLRLEITKHHFLAPEFGSQNGGDKGRSGFGDSVFG
jgi:hypothetical protein